MRVITLLTICSLMLLPASVMAVEDELSDGTGWSTEFSGYYKNILEYQERDDFHAHYYSTPESKKLAADMNRLRLSPEISYAESFYLHADFDIEAVSANYKHSDEFDASWKISQYNEPVKSEIVVADTESSYAVADFRNLYARGIAGKFTGTAGRQQVRFGNSRLWNPLDLMTPFSPLALEGADEQKGTDSLRLDWFPGESTELTGVAAPKLEGNSYGDTGPGSGNYLARFKTGVKELDVALLGGYTAKRADAGGDFAAELFQGLLTGSLLYSNPREGRSYWQCGAGYEYTFGSGLYLLVEFFYNSLPVNEDTELQYALSGFIYNGLDESNYYILSNRIITYNSYYASAVAGYDFHPLLRGELFLIYDFQGRGIFVNASMKFNAMENLDITAGVITAFVDDTGRVSDFSSYDGAPMFNAIAQFYF